TAIANIVARRLARDPANRPASAAAIAAALPHAEAAMRSLVDARAHVPTESSDTHVLRPSAAWAMLAAVVVGIVTLASQPEIFTLKPIDVPNPPEVLASRAREILRRAASVGEGTDSEFWMTPTRRPPGGDAPSASIRL